MALPTSNPQGNEPKKGLPVPPPQQKADTALPRLEEVSLPVPPQAQAPRASTPAPPEAKPAAPKIDFSSVPLNKIKLSDYNIDVKSLPVLQAAKGKPTAKNFIRELRLLQDDGNPRGPIVVDPETGRVFRKMPVSEFAGDDPVLQVDDFNADDLNSEASLLLGHLQVTSSREEKAIALAQRKARLAAQEAAQQAAQENPA